MREAILIAFSILPLAKPGCALTPRIVIVRLVGREGLVLQVAGALAVHGVAEVGAELLDVDVIDAVADFLIRREQDPQCPVLDIRIGQENVAASMISAMPALLSAPSKVVPSLVMRSWPIWSFSAGWSAMRITWVRSPGSVMSPPW